ncbi:MAG: HTTM domain-containing protein [Fulvivirga sp.]|nr:HTTM domain-containing protein [Fulvivirga sp.]
MNNNLSHLLKKPVSIAPLAVFRVLFGFIMFVSVARFVLNGWVQTQYIDPQFYFSFYGFEWIKPLDAFGMYTLFGVMAISALAIMLGAYYRISAVLFFLSFTYVELIDKTNYLNHYYFISVISFMLIFLPAHRYFSWDVIRKPWLKLETIPHWFVLVIQLQLAIVYFYAGAAKLNADWMLAALPLKMWLPVNNHLPLIGPLLDQEWVAYFFSWFGAIYDLTIPFFLFFAVTRSYAYIAVIAFHLITWLLFPIGMFPFIMIALTLIFFGSDFHHKVINKLTLLLQKLKLNVEVKQQQCTSTSISSKFAAFVLAIVLLFQIVMPWRYMLYPGNLFWTEEGYRFSWRVMLMEKAGYVIFHLKDPNTGKRWEAYASDFLTPMQEKQMSTQPDMILQYARFLEQKHMEQGGDDIEVRAEAYVTLNGRGSRLLIDPAIDLTRQKDGFTHKNWILSYQ